MDWRPTTAIEAPAEPRLLKLSRFLFALALALLIPWIAYLAADLPSRHTTGHWDAVWVGFDVFEALVCAVALWALWRRSPYLPIAAGAFGALLLADAWFDCVTAAGGELDGALLWLCLELPLAALSFALAVKATRDPQWLVRLHPPRRPRQ